MDARKIRVLIVDDHVVVRSGLRLFLWTFEDIELVGEASNGKEALAVCEQASPDVVLMDLVMPVCNGVQAIRTIHEKWPQIQIIALTSFAEEDMVEEALQAGAISYLLKNVSAADLTEAVRAAYQGRSVLSPEAAQARMVRSRGHSLGDDLTRREKQVLGLMAKGFSNAAIADHLVISKATAKYHVSRVLAKLGAKTRSQVVALALHNHLVDSDDAN